MAVIWDSNLWYIPAHEAAEMDQQICATLPVFHAGATPFLHSVVGAKKNCMEHLESYPEVTRAFEELLLM